MPMAICVYCSSSNAVEAHFVAAAQQLGQEMARSGHTLIYGGGDIGLMGALARAMHQHGGRVIGVIPHFMNQPGIVYEAADELILADNMRQRKDIMEQRADAFVALPGGIGTLEELAEIITLKQLHQHQKPIVILNTKGFYDPLLAFLRQLTDLKFAKPSFHQHYRTAANPHEVLSMLAEPGT
ncbi:MAG: TIGR00730 family Rossman fold protein [Phycisphaeraceae bacterium]|nr:TIGR00730 family Rossman fold protein [Phycisphaeraceae bacterium]